VKTDEEGGKPLFEGLSILGMEPLAEVSHPCGASRAAILFRFFQYIDIMKEKVDAELEKLLKENDVMM
jgi:hypothetical protein